MFTPSPNSNPTTTKTKMPMFLSPTPTPPNSSSSNPRTPPPSLPSSPSFHTPTFGAKAFLPEVPTSTPQHEKPKHRLRLWHTLFIPLVLLAVGLSTRWIRHPVVLDSLVGLTRPDPESNSFFHKRHPDGVSVSINLPTPTSSSSSPSPPPSSSSSSTSTSIPLIPTTTPILPTPFPQPWDQSGVPLNFSTQGCHNFFLNMTNSESFRSCRSFGMLQAWSDNFIDAQTNLTLLSQVLWGTCNPPLGADACTDGLRQWAEEMVNEDNNGACQQEWNERNEVVVRSRAALLSYPLLLSTSCLALSNTNTYCYLSSIAQGASAASDIYLYSLPLGVSFPKTARPSCGACEKDLLGAFGGYLGSSSLSPSSSSSSSSSSNSDPKNNPILDLSDSSQTVGLKATYQDAVSVIEGTCGTGFVATGTALGSHSNAGVSDSVGMGMAMVLLVMMWGLGL